MRIDEIEKATRLIEYLKDLHRTIEEKDRIMRGVTINFDATVCTAPKLFREFVDKAKRSFLNTLFDKMIEEKICTKEQLEKMGVEL